MQQYWVNFARTGDPNGSGLPVWPKYDATTRPYMEFMESGAAPKENLRRSFCAVFAENALRQLKR
jgi:para-nitrobenzyl esterase